MSQYESLNPDQIEFEDALRQLQPGVCGINPATLMYEAGRDAAFQESQLRLRRWQVSTFVTSACALIAVTVLWPGIESDSTSHRSVTEQSDPVTPPEQPPSDRSTLPVEEPSPSELVVETSTPSNVDLDDSLQNWGGQPTQFSESLANSYIALRNRIMREGLDALPDRDFSQETSYSNLSDQREPLRLRDAHDPKLWNQI